MVRIRWSMDEEGRGRIEIYAGRGPEEGRLEAVQPFESLAEVPSAWSRTIQEDGRREGESVVQ